MDLEQTLRSENIILGKDKAAPTSETSDRPTRIQIGMWILITLLAFAISSSNFLAYQVGSRFDEERYLILARSLVLADHYGMVNSPGEPLPERFPFGYPLLISPIVWLFPEHLDAPKVLSLIATVVNVALLFWAWRWFSRSRSYWWSVAIAGLYALSPLTIDFSRRIMAEPVFLTFSLISILLVEQIVQGRPNRWLLPALSAALTFVVFTRTIGIALMVCSLLYLLLKKGKPAGREIAKICLLIGIFVGMILIITPVQLADLIPSWYLKNDKNAWPLVTVIAEETTATTGGTGSTTDRIPHEVSSAWNQKITSLRWLVLSGFGRVFGENLRWITVPFGLGVVRQMGDLGTGDPSLILRIYNGLVSGLVLLGLCLLIRQERLSLFSVYPIFYLGALFFWNFNHPRFFYPIQPQIQFAWLLAIEALVLWTVHAFRGSKFSRRPAYLALASFTVLMLTGSIFNSLLIQGSQVHTGDLRIRSEWLKAHTNPSDIIMTEKPEVDYLYSGRKTVPYPNTLPLDEELETYLIDNRIDYILVAPRTGWFDQYSPVYSDGTKDLVLALERLRLNNRIQLVYSLDSYLIRVYRAHNIGETSGQQ